MGAIAIRGTENVRGTREGKPHHTENNGSTAATIPSPLAGIKERILPTDSELQGESVARPLKELASLPLRPLVERYIAGKKSAHLSDSIVLQNEMWLKKHLLARFDNTRQLTAENVSDFMDGLRREDDSELLAAATRQQCWRTLVAFAHWLEEREILHRVFTKGVDAPRVKPKPFILPTSEEVAAMLAACNKGVHGLQNRAVVMLLTDLGVRVGELLNFRFSDWLTDTEGNHSLQVREAKTDAGAWRVIPIQSEATVEALQQYVERRGEPQDTEEHIFVTGTGKPISERHVLKVVHMLWRRAGNDPARRPHCHTFRHLAITNRAESGMPVAENSKLAGHTNPRFTERVYYHPSQQHMTATVRKFGATDRFFKNGKKPAV